jgi:hypothetical protein
VKGRRRRVSQSSCGARQNGGQNAVARLQPEPPLGVGQAYEAVLALPGLAICSVRRGRQRVERPPRSFLRELLRDARQLPRCRLLQRRCRSGRKCDVLRLRWIARGISVRRRRSSSVPTGVQVRRLKLNDRVQRRDILPAGKCHGVGLHGAGGALLSKAKHDGVGHSVPAGPLLCGGRRAARAVSRAARILLHLGLQGRCSWRAVQPGALLCGEQQFEHTMSGAYGVLL